jgi:hypothetical protein
MSPFTRFRKSPEELQKIADQVRRVYDKENPLEVDIELTLEANYGLRIDVVPLVPACGVEAFLNLEAKTVYVHADLADLSSNEGHYRPALAEELAHFILHKDLFHGVSSIEDYLRVYESIPEIDFRWFERDAKTLAGMILTDSKIWEDHTATALIKLALSNPAPSPPVTITP